MVVHTKDTFSRREASRVCNSPDWQDVVIGSLSKPAVQITYAHKADVTKGIRSRNPEAVGRPRTPGDERHGGDWPINFGWTALLLHADINLATETAAFQDNNRALYAEEAFLHNESISTGKRNHVHQMPIHSSKCCLPANAFGCVRSKRAYRTKHRKLLIVLPHPQIQSQPHQTKPRAF